MSISALAYIGFTSPSAEEWRHFGPNILGAQLAPSSTTTSDDEVRLRIDERAYRVSVAPGPANDVAHLGWDVHDAAGLTHSSAAVAAAGIEVHQGDADLLADRGVEALAWFLDPFGFRHELTYGAPTASEPFAPGRPISGFVTGAGGLGHVVLFVADLDAANAFYTHVLGFRRSDEVEMGPLFLRFLHCNPRHHTVALAAIPGMRGIHHLMLEVASVDDVGTGYDLCVSQDLPLAMTFGKHTNDLMTSFYVRTPSGFEIEYGYGGVLVDDTTWVVPEPYRAISIWGHRPPATPLFPGVIHPLEVSA
jgi:extradiol dioxygenase